MSGRSFAGFEVQVTDVASGARPALSQPGGRRRSSRRSAVSRGPSSAGRTWPDSTRWAIPAVNYGPGDPTLAHRRDEHVPLAQIAECETRMLGWLAQ